jgi:hypothetical protein
MRAMKPNNFIIGDTNELIIRGSHKKIPFFLLFITIPCIALVIELQKSSQNFFTGNLFVAIFFLTICCGGTAYSWFKFFDKRIRLIINQNGIWMSKSGLIEWNNIWYYHFTEDIVKAREYHCFAFKIKSDHTEYKIDITFLDKAYQQIQEAISINSKKYSIIDLGFESR